MPTTTTAAATPVIRTTDFAHQTREFLTVSAAWLTSHWLQILIASGIATAIVFALHGLRALGSRLCSRNPGALG